MEIDQLRAQIDQLDTNITDLVCQRLNLCGQIAAAKQREGKDVLVAEREKEILARVCKQAGKEYETYVKKLYIAMFQLCRCHQTILISPGSGLKE
ncbi:MAG TPA: chorismate mutase [bacterium]|jgi:chorismate mutase|nr:chorismate mutase [bacterium]